MTDDNTGASHSPIDGLSPLRSSYDPAQLVIVALLESNTLALNLPPTELKLDACNPIDKSRLTRRLLARRPLLSSIVESRATFIPRLEISGSRNTNAACRAHR